MIFNFRNKTIGIKVIRRIHLTPALDAAGYSDWQGACPGMIDRSRIIIGSIARDNHTRDHEYKYQNNSLHKVEV